MDHRDRSAPRSAARRSGGSPAPDALLRDARLAVRLLLRRPGFTVVAALTLGLGIGADTAVFSVVNAVLLRELPVARPGELVEVYTSSSDGAVHATSSWPDYLDLREGVDAFQGLVAHALAVVPTDSDRGVELLVGETVSGNFFEVLGIEPILGRGFLPEEDATPGTHAVAVVSHAYWQRALDGDPGAIGATIRLNRRPYTVVGVAPEGMTGMWPGLSVDAWVPMAMVGALNPSDVDPLQSRGSRSLFVKGRLAPGATVERAAAQVEALASALAERHPGSNEGRTMSVVPTGDVALHPAVDRVLAPVAALLLTAVGLVLLIACANLASFLLARAEDRRGEIAVRLSLGASRAALIRQLLVETSILGLLGGGVGLLLAAGALRLLAGFQPPVPLPMNLDVPLDGTVLLYTLGISVGAGLLFGLAPALRSTRVGLSGTLRDGGVSVAGRRSRLRDGLVVVQVAFSFLLLAGAGLFVRSLAEARAVDPGFYTGAAAILWPNLRMSGLGEEEGRATWSRLEEALEAAPGIDAVTVADVLPLGVGLQTTDLRFEGHEGPRANGTTPVDHARVGPDWFEVMEVPLLEGRTFTGAEASPGSPPTAVVSAALARRWFSGGALGRTFERRDGTPVRIVGVARDTRVRTLGEAPRPKVYFPAGSEYLESLQLVVRGPGSSAELLATARRVVSEVEPDVVLFDALTMEEHLGFMLFAPRMAALLLAVFGGVALALAAVGVYGMVRHAVASRTREMGIRLSLGASPRAVRRHAVGGGLRPVALGAALGLLLAAGLTRLLAGWLIGVGPFDPATFAAIPAVLGAVAFLAAWLPARRASRIDPVRALRAG